MKTQRVTLSLLVGTLFFLLPPSPGYSAGIYSTRHVIQISVDGLGAAYLGDYLKTAPDQFPTFTRLCTNGAFTLNARRDPDNSVTMPNHACMLTGRPVLQPQGWPNTTQHGYALDYDNEQTLHDSGNLNVPYKASVLDVIHDNGLSTAFFASKPKFALYVRSYDADHGAPDTTGVNNGAGKIDFAMLTDATTNPPTWEASGELMDALLVQLASEPWNYVFLHFAEPDYNGHFSSGWGSPEYSNAVRHVDQQLARLLEAIESNPELSNHTALVITADHGGRISHGNPYDPLEYALPFFLWGPGIPPGANLYDLMANRVDPGTERITYADISRQPIRNGDSGNLALALLGLPPIPGSSLIPQLKALQARVTLTKAAENQMLLSWPSAQTNFVMEITTNLSPSATWETITNGITDDGVTRTFAVPAIAGTPHQFFRLRKSTAP